MTPTPGPNRASSPYANPGSGVAHTAMTAPIPRGSRSAANLAANVVTRQATAVSNFATNGAVEHLRYTESSPIHVRGPITGKTYQFSGTQPVQAVDKRDAASLLQTRFFRRS